MIFGLAVGAVLGIAVYTGTIGPLTLGIVIGFCLFPAVTFLASAAMWPFR